MATANTNTIVTLHSFATMLRKCLTERVRDIKVKVRKADLSKDPRFRAARSPNRQHQNLMPNYKKFVAPIHSSIDNMLDGVKKANRGIWRITNAQVLDVAKKYKFFIPNKNYPTKHLGSTGIVLWRKAPNKYFLVKQKKQRYKRGF
jgi:hypothetical protein